MRRRTVQRRIYVSWTRSRLTRVFFEASLFLWKRNVLLLAFDIVRNNKFLDKWKPMWKRSSFLEKELSFIWNFPRACVYRTVQDYLEFNSSLIGCNLIMVITKSISTYSLFSSEAFFIRLYISFLKCNYIKLLLKSITKYILSNDTWFAVRIYT